MQETLAAATDLVVLPESMEVLESVAAPSLLLQLEATPPRHDRDAGPALSARLEEIQQQLDQPSGGGEVRPEGLLDHDAGPAALLVAVQVRSPQSVDRARERAGGQREIERAPRRELVRLLDLTEPRAEGGVGRR